MAKKKRSAGRKPDPCPACGRAYALKSQIERVKKKLGAKAGMVEICPGCRRERYAKALRQSCEEAINTG